METNIGVIVYWNSHPWTSSHPGGPKRWLSFYIFTMQAFGADTLLLIGGPKIEHGYDIKFQQFETLHDALKEYKNYKVVTLDASAEKTLQEYNHPKEKVLYFIGNDYSDVEEVEGDKIRIDNVIDSTILWSHSCLSMVLYDRFIKNGSNK